MKRIFKYILLSILIFIPIILRISIEEPEQIIADDSIIEIVPTDPPIIQLAKREIKPKETWYVGYINNETDIINTVDTVKFNTRIHYTDYDDEYYKVKYNGSYGLIKKEYLSFEKFKYKSIIIKSHGFKSYTRYTALTRKTSLQYKLQQEYAYTGDYGIRQVNGRYCIAVGSAVSTKIGQYVDVVLENGTVIPCIVADQKADEHTKSDNITTAHNKCVCEFYLDYILPEIEYNGDVSSACEEWQSPVCEFRVYDVNIFEEEML